MWFSLGLSKDDNSVLRTAMILPLVPEEEIIKCYEYIQKIVDKTLNEKEQLFCNELRLIVNNLINHISLVIENENRYNNVLDFCKHAYKPIYNATSLGELIGKYVIIFIFSNITKSLK